MQGTLRKVVISPFPLVRVFIIIYLTLNLIGIINFPIYNDTIFNIDVVWVFLTGLIGFVLGAFLFRSIKFGIKESSPNNKKSNILKILFIVSTAVTFLFILYSNIRTGHIIIFSSNSRFVIFGFTNIFIYITIVSTMAYYANRLLQNKKIRLIDILIVGVQAILILSLGFRSPVISLLGGLFIVFYSIRNDFQNSLKKIFSWKILLAVLIFLSLMSSISALRVSQKFNLNRYFKNINSVVLQKNPYLEPFVPTLALFRFDQEVVDKLIKKTKGNSMRMGLAISNVLTILPGKQEGARNIVGRLTNAPKKYDGKYWSITPTLQGAFFVDGGFFLVFFGFFATAFVMELIRKVMIKKRNPFIFALYGLTVIAVLKCIHTGYEDITFFIIVITLFILKFLVYNINYTVRNKIEA